MTLSFATSDVHKALQYPIPRTSTKRESIVEQCFKEPGITFFRHSEGRLIPYKQMNTAPTGLDVESALMKNVQGSTSEHLKLMKQRKAIVDYQQENIAQFHSTNELQGGPQCNECYLKIPITSHYQGIEGIKIAIDGKCSRGDDIGAWIEHAVLDSRDKIITKEALIIIDNEQDYEEVDYSISNMQLINQLKKGNSYCLFARSGQQSKIFLRGMNVTFLKYVPVINKEEDMPLERRFYSDSEPNSDDRELNLLNFKESENEKRQELSPQLQEMQSDFHRLFDQKLKEQEMKLERLLNQHQEGIRDVLKGNEEHLTQHDVDLLQIKRRLALSLKEDEFMEQCNRNILVTEQFMQRQNRQLQINFVKVIQDKMREHKIDMEAHVQQIIDQIQKNEEMRTQQILQQHREYELREREQIEELLKELVNENKKTRESSRNCCVLF